MSTDASTPIESQPVVGAEFIRIRGARVHNLRDIDIDIPRDRFIVLTGSSGSGKSSLAFDTIYAEGQRQFIESLSVYARQFVNQMERPDVDLIEGLQPTICIDQRPGNQNPRSTVATVTEIYDYLRLLMARLGQPYCYQCGALICQQTSEQIQSRLMELPEGTRTMILSPLVRGRRGQHKDTYALIRKAGFVRARIDGEVYDIENLPELAARKVHHIEAVVDRIIIRPGIEARLGESVQLAVRYGEGLAVACYYLEEKKSDDSTPQGQWRDELFSTIYACPKCNLSYEELEPRTFSFNSPYGACPTCDGLGVREEFDPELVMPDFDLSLAEGAVAPWRTATAAALRKIHSTLESFLKSIGADLQTSLCEFSDKSVHKLLHGDTRSKFSGILLMLEKEHATATRKGRLEQLTAFRGQIVCRDCLGSRLRPEASSVRIGDRTIAEITGLSVSDARTFFDELQFDDRDEPIALPLLTEIRKRLEFLAKVGVNYLTLNRPADTLSGGESQRVRLATSIGSGLVGVCYVLDEPSIGLHQRDNQRLIDALRDLQHQGNTVIVVEHDEAMIRQADELIDIGPGAGADGGRIMAQGPPDTVNAADSITVKYLTGVERIEVPAKRRRVAKARSIWIDGATTNNLKNVEAMFPLGCLICVTGVSGSGKSSLINETLSRALVRRLGGLAPKPGNYSSLRGVSQIDKVIQIDQSPIGRTPRSNAATYSGLFDEIRKVFAGTRDAKQRGYRVSRFSFNAKGGRCEECQGRGVKKIEMNFLPDLYVTCNECDGARFNRSTLQVRYRNKSIADVLGMAVADAVEFFENFAGIHRTLECLRDVGLGYLPLGQPSTTLSGGEAQRIKLATQLARVDTGKTLYLLDEPTTGLHFDDIRRLLDVLNRLVDRGNTVIVIEHNLDVIKSADWLIDLGPEGGEEGGQIVATGTPEQVAALADNHTGRFLKPLLGMENGEST